MSEHEPASGEAGSKDPRGLSLDNSSSELEEFFESVQAIPVFTRRPSPIPVEYRVVWRTAIVCLLLNAGRATTLSTEHLHVLWWAIRDPGSRDTLLRAFEGRRRPEDLVVRFDPSLTVSLNLALAEGLCKQQSSLAAVKLAAAGSELCEKIYDDDSLLVPEKIFLSGLPAKLSAKKLDYVLGWK